MRSFSLNILLFIILGQPVKAQVKLSFDSVTREITYRTVVKAPSMSKEALYQASLSWFTLNYHPATGLILTNDLGKGKLVGVCNFIDSFRFIEPGIYYAILNATISYNLNLNIKPGQCSITLNGLHFKYYIPGASIANPSDTGITVENNFESQYYTMLTKMNNEPRRKRAWMAFFRSCDRRLKLIVLSYRKYMKNIAPNSAGGL